MVDDSEATVWTEFEDGGEAAATVKMSYLRDGEREMKVKERR